MHNITRHINNFKPQSFVCRKKNTQVQQAYYTLGNLSSAKRDNSGKNEKHNKYYLL